MAKHDELLREIYGLLASMSLDTRLVEDWCERADAHLGPPVPESIPNAVLLKTRTPQQLIRDNAQPGASGRNSARQRALSLIKRLENGLHD
jgi:hypothetical protein